MRKTLGCAPLFHVCLGWALAANRPAKNPHNRKRPGRCSVGQLVIQPAKAADALSALPPCMRMSWLGVVVKMFLVQLKLHCRFAESRKHDGRAAKALQ